MITSLFKNLCGSLTVLRWNCHWIVWIAARIEPSRNTRSNHYALHLDDTDCGNLGHLNPTSPIGILGHERGHVPTAGRAKS